MNGANHVGPAVPRGGKWGEEAVSPVSGTVLSLRRGRCDPGPGELPVITPSGRTIEARGKVDANTRVLLTWRVSSIAGSYCTGGKLRTELI